MLTTTDARGVTLAYSYDKLNRKVAEYQGSADANGSELASWTFDSLAKGQLTSSTSYTGSAAGAPGLAYTDTITGYNDAYQPTGNTISVPVGAPAFGGTSYTDSTAYNPDGSLQSTVLPAEGGLPAETVRDSYNAQGSLASVYGIKTYGLATYTGIGQLAQVTRNASIVAYSTFGYDAGTGAVTDIKETTQTGSIFATPLDRAYVRDDAGNITKAAATSDTTATDTQCYSYDHLSELTAAWTPSSGDCTATPDAGSLGGPAPYLEQYSYDTATGDRLSATVVNGAASTQQVFAYPAAGTARPHAVQSVTTTGSSNQTNTYGYDSAGDTTTRPGQTLSYDPTGKLATITTGTGSTADTQQDVYDASGTLLLRTDATGSTLFLGETELHQASGSTDVSAVRTYSLAGKVVAERTTQPGVTGNGDLQWLGSDVDGTTDLEVDSTTGTVTRRYSDPFGNSRGTVPAWSSDHGFLNKTVDTSTGLTQLGARVYDGTIGKFLTVDPILAPDNPVQDNGYTYADNNPVTLTDATGLDPAMHQCDNTDTAACRNFFYGGSWTDKAPPAGKSKGGSRASSSGSAIDSYLTHTTGVPSDLNVTAAEACGWNSSCINAQPDRYQAGPAYHPAPDSLGQKCKGWKDCLIKAGTAAVGVCLIVCGLIGDATDAAIEGTAQTVTDDGAAAAVGDEEAGTNLYRVHGGDSGPLGHSWTPENPLEMSNPRGSLGLPNGNAGTMLTKARLVDGSGIVTRGALPLDGNIGGAQEWLIPNPGAQLHIDWTIPLRPPI